MVATIVPEGVTYGAFKRTPECREAFSKLVETVKAEKAEKRIRRDSHAIIAERWAAMTGRPKPAPIPLVTMPGELEAPVEVGPCGVPAGGTEPAVSEVDPVFKAPMPDFPESGSAPKRRGRPPGSRNRPSADA